jgi:hypothetical protein
MPGRDVPPAEETNEVHNPQGYFELFEVLFDLAGLADFSARRFAQYAFIRAPMALRAAALIFLRRDCRLPAKDRLSRVARAIASAAI